MSDEREPTTTRVVLATLDIENPDRPYLFNNEIATQIARALGGHLAKTTSDTPVWAIGFGTGANYCSIMMQSHSRNELSPRFIAPAYDSIFIQRHDYPRGRGWFRTADSINGITSVEIEGSKVTFVQDVGDWVLRYSINPGGRPEIYLDSKDRPHTKTVGSFSFELKNSGGSKSVLLA